VGCLRRNCKNRMRKMIVGVVRDGSICLLVFLASFLSPRSGWAAEQYYDLGGPCRDQPGMNLQEIHTAEQSGSWDRVVELEKALVRGGCRIQYRWYELANALLEAHRQTEAVLVMQEMDSRGFDLNPSFIGKDHPEVEKFMGGQVFRASPVGMKIEQLERLSNERRIRFREALKMLPSNQRPPRNYIARDACPFECCRFGDWTVLQDTVLVATPGSKRLVGKATKGSSAVGLTGEVHLTPEPVVVVVDGELPRDTIAFVLDYLGEGVGHVYTRGKIVTTSFGYAEYCLRPSESCWGETLLPLDEQKKRVWWVKVRLANGLTGWTDKADNFGHKDACG
jgi:hypothetical protein